MTAGRTNPQGQGREPSRKSQGQTVPEQEYADQVKSGEDPDVLLDVPVLKVEELTLELEDLRAHVSLRADLANLVNVNVGVDAYLDKVKLEIKGVEAQVLLKVRLDRVLETFNRALETIDNNPEILGGLLRGGGSGEGEDNADSSSENIAPLDGATGEAGRTTRRSVDETGNLVETTLDEAGAVAEEKVTGNLEDLPVEEEFVDDEGRIVSRARDEQGNVVERLLDDEGNVIGVDDPETPEGEIEATDAARKKARELGVELSGITGTGADGRVLVADVEQAAKGQS
jgi:hypothetical protein